MLIGEKFKAVRKAKDYTLQSVASAMGMKSTGHLSQIERGEKEPSDMLINSFKATFSVSELWWNTGDGPMFAEGVHTPTIAEHMGVIYDPKVKLFADFMQLQLEGKTEEEQAKITAELMKDLFQKIK